LKKVVLVVPLVVVLVGLGLTGCTINIGSPDSEHSHGMMSQNDSLFSSADIMFAQMMIPHHQQAVDMGTLAETRASDSEVKALAAQIKSEQTPEIEQMKSWLDKAGAGMNMGHDMGMGGMLSATEMTSLKAATGKEFDRLYVQGMIGHHEGAIAMANMVIDSSNSEVQALGKAIIDSQTKQIETLKTILKRLG
jgi:uncharacterized protein (DUF305 family)